MNTFGKIFLGSFLAFGLVAMINGFTYSNAVKAFNVGVVDVQKIVENYDKVNTLKTDRKVKIDSLRSFIENARTQVAKESNETQKKALEDKLNKELNDKKNAIDTEYAKQLEIINKNVTDAINKVAKEKQADVVLAKNSVLFGGDDISNDVLKALKK